MSTEIEGAIITPVSSMGDGNIPLDLQVQILSLLPVKSLIRFKSVCKEWSAFFSNPNFINKHLNLTSQNPYHDSIVVHRFSNTGDHMTNIVFNGSIDRPITLPNPYPNWELELVGSVNGIICYCSLPVRKLVVLWNPATQYRKVIRYHKPRNLLGEMHYVRFGYDQVDNDFKIIWIERERERNSSVMELYSVNKNSWIEIKVPFDLNTLNTDFNTTVKGMFCFSAFIGYRGRYREDLLGFDFHNEVLHRFPTVEHVISEPGWECLTNLNNTLGMVVYYKANRVFKYFEVDAEYSCLSKIYTVGPISSDVKVNWLLTCFKNGHIVFEGHRGNIFSLDPKTMKSKNLGVNGAKSKSHRYRAFCYTGSLVFVEGMEHFNKHQRKEKPTG